MTKFRCSNCGAIVDESQVKCHACGAVFHSGSKPSILGALTGGRPIDEIKNDWVYEIRKAIVGGTKKTFGIDDEGKDTFKKPKQLESQTVEIIDSDDNIEIIDAEFEVVEEETIKPRKATTLDDLPQNVRDALNKRMGGSKDDSDNNSE